MYALLYLTLAFSSPSPDRYLIDLSMGSWKQLNGNARLEFLGDGRAEVFKDSSPVLHETSKVAPEPEFVLPTPIWKNHSANLTLTQQNRLVTHKALGLDVFFNGNHVMNLNSLHIHPS